MVPETTRGGIEVNDANVIPSDGANLLLVYDQGKVGVKIGTVVNSISVDTVCDGKIVSVVTLSIPKHL